MFDDIFINIEATAATEILSIENTALYYYLIITLVLFSSVNITIEDTA